MTEDSRRELIAQYDAGVAEVEAALAGFPASRLTDHPIPGKWSAAEIVHHLADSEGNSAIRLRKLLTEKDTVIQGYDQEEWARTLRYNERPIAPALAAFRAARETTSQLLHAMRPEDWRRQGTHSESGPYSMERWLEIYAVHAHGHASQIRRLREAMGC
jgi:hypothetical protein